MEKKTKRHRAAVVLIVEKSEISSSSQPNLKSIITHINTLFPSSFFSNQQGQLSNSLFNFSKKIEEVSASLSLSEEADVHAKNTEKVPPLDLEKNNEASVVTRRKKLLVLDLNGLLADIVSPLADCKADINIGRRAIFKRPFCEEFLKFCFDKFEVGIWSSRKKNNVDRITEFLLGDMKRRLLFCWDMSYCATTTLGSLENRHKYVVFKDLNQLWGKHDPRLPWQKGDYNETNTVLLDDSPYKALLNPPYTAIFPQSYSHQNKSDTSLGNGGDLRLHLEKLVEAENVQDFIKKNPFGQEAITEASETWEFYREATPPPQSGSSTGISGTCLIHRRFMAETLLSFGVERLWNLLVRESERFQGFNEQLNVLKNDMKMLRCFLEDAYAKKHTSAMMENIIKDIKEIVLDAEDMVETFLLKEELKNTRGIKNSARKFSCSIFEHRGLAFSMEAISKRISKVIRDMMCHGVQQVNIVNEGYTQSLQEIRTFSGDNGDHLVGWKKNVEILVGYLLDEDSSQVVSITGMGGIGKTTLARKVYNHRTIKSHFPRLAWVCVSQQFTKKDVWQTILQQLRPEIKVSEYVLQEKLSEVLETQKALIVIDDIWREGDWDRIKYVFLPKKGCKVLHTSRNEGVALHADRQCVTFKPKCLTFEESWDLFQRIAFPMKDTSEFKIDEEMKEMGKQMIKHCGGLPLALKVLGGLLAAQYTLCEWKKIYENIGSYIVGGTSFNERNVVYHVLYLSFEELPAYLKHCFLYLAHFPEDYKIDVEDLSYYWAAEGIQRPRYYAGASIRELHDMMREVCLLKAEEENFVEIIQGTSTANSKSSCKSRRLVVHNPDETFNVDTEVKNPSLRTLLFIKCRGWRGTSLFFTRHKLMRVLDLSRVKFEGWKVPSSIGKLIHLRYLSLFCASAEYETAALFKPRSTFK
ncbi:hypothetical protein DY000_02011081 [Brassica cretica]|uniref:FCP1 homology domain-containing protein n=1 Tax=Brassica cretica TaxID=69181 RepID=A0ABQ7D1I0_BRACR|nr:hypothetical protein DY000_02011081 [Brassica cretica]